MIPVTLHAGQAVAVFGLGISGMAAAAALIAGGAHVVADDDRAERVRAADAAGIPTASLRDADWSVFAALVLSPGVPLTHPAPHWAVAAATAAGIPVIGDLDLFFRQRAVDRPDAPVVAITGTNGKSTTTALIAHLLREARKDVAVGGNIGTAALALAPFAPGRVHVLEVSSYQIALAPALAPTVGVHLNLSEDHIDRHGSMAAYAALKERLVAASRTAVVGIDDPMSLAIADGLAAAGRHVVRISARTAVGEGLWAGGRRITEARDGRRMLVTDLTTHPVLRGAHNMQNAAAAIAAVRALGLVIPEIRVAIASFPGLPHRMEPVARLGRVLFVNDSKATNADAAARALASYDRIYWIAGGRPKTGGIAGLARYFPRIAKAYLIGEAAGEFAATLAGQVPVVEAGTLAAAVLAAATDAADDPAAEPVVLLSPACASFDQFTNFEHRGESFRSLVEDLVAAEVG